MPAHPLEGVADLQYRVFAFAQENGVEEVADRLGVQNAGAAGDDEGIGLGSLRRREPEAAQIEHVEQVRVGQLVAQAYPENVEVAQCPAGLQAPERQSGGSQLVLEVDVGREATLCQPVGPVVEHLVQDPQPQVAHPDLVQVGIGEAPLQGDGGPILPDRVPLTAGVPAGFPDAPESPFDRQRRERRRGVVRSGGVEGGRRWVLEEGRAHD